MAKYRRKLLRTGNKDGVQVGIVVYHAPDGFVSIRSNYIPEVEKDNPVFSKKGQLNLLVEQKDYASTIEHLENYLENLFLKELSNEDVHPSSGAGTNSGGDEKVDTGRATKEDSGEGNSPSVHSGSRRKKSAGSSRGGDETTSLDKGSGEEAGE